MRTLIVALLATQAALTSFGGVKIKGSNGTEVEFSAIFDAKPAGMVALLSPESSAITVPWTKIDLETLKTGQPEIYKAYEKALATQKDQPLGMGLASEMLSLGQLPEALKQAVKDPYYWPYSNYSYQTVYIDSSGKTSTRSYTTSTRYPPGYISSNTPFVILKRIRDTSEDKAKKELLYRFQNGGYGSYGVNTMLERLEYTVGRIPTAKMFPRDAQTIRLVQESTKFRKMVEGMLTADTITSDHQSAIKSYFSLIGIE
ncbi:MAG: hypothetical protein H8M99_08265 [Gloeobacteraceae cyanobacterium ES-bin-144]|nr:hypothetical protein [Verrucomicrobiales bacterium]